jgi:hypothetical protein
MSTPATRLSYFILLMRPKRYGGRREMRGETSILNGAGVLMVLRGLYRRNHVNVAAAVHTSL